MSLDLSLYKLSDMLQMNLEYVAGKVSGFVSGVLKTPGGPDFPVTLTALKLFYGEQCGVICHVMGDLYILASHYPKLGGLSLFIINGARLSIDGVRCPPDKMISSSSSLSDIIKEIRPGVVAAYHYKGEWKSLTLPK